MWVTIYHKENKARDGSPLKARVTKKAYKEVWRDRGFRLAPPKVEVEETDESR